MYLAVLDEIQIVAVKVVTAEADAAPTPAQLQQFETEIAIMRAARHQNVVNFIGAHLDQVWTNAGARLVAHFLQASRFRTWGKSSGCSFAKGEQALGGSTLHSNLVAEDQACFC